VPPRLTADHHKIAPQPLDVRTTLTTRLLPEPHSSPRRVPLSVLDSTVARFAPTSDAWIYDFPEGEREQVALSVGQIQESLQKMHNAYPRWAGQLHFADYNSDGDVHAQRFYRIILLFGGETDPGVELVIAHCPRSVPSLIPGVRDRVVGRGW
jgi:hypothetical protein